MTISEFANNEDPHPPGTILMWTGRAVDIPRGWLLCDGNNGTPNLLNKFPKSVPDVNTDPGSTGGSNSKTLTENQLPNHGHNTTLSSSGEHDHGLGRGGEENPHNDSGVWLPDDSRSTNVAETYDSTDWSHSHTFTSESVGGGSSIDNQPSYRSAHFIQKA